MDDIRISEGLFPVRGLGAARDCFPTRKGYRWGSLTISLIFLAGATAVFFTGIYRAGAAFLQHGPTMIDDTLPIPLGIALGLFAIGVVAGWLAYTGWDKSVVVYERGFTSNDRKGQQTWFWEDVVSMRSVITRHYASGIYTGTTRAYTLYNQQNDRLVLSDSLSKVEELATLIEEKIFPRLYHEAAEQYNTGQASVWGPVAIDKTAITIRRKTFPWVEVKEVSVRRGVLKVKTKKGGWFSDGRAATGDIPNLRVLLTIIQQVVGINAS